MIALIDIDNLKQVNDSYGHQVGDLYIAAVARRLSASLAGTDLIGRWGGDEFLIVLDLPGSRSGLVLDRARAAVTSNPVGAGDRLLPVSVSVGAADWPARQPLDASLALADAALYEAKSAGRNRTSYER
jgi:diguanylate cyclase (GGDEF)-like protein